MLYDFLSICDFWSQIIPTSSLSSWLIVRRITVGQSFLYIVIIELRYVWVFVCFIISVLDPTISDGIIRHWRIFWEWFDLWWEISFNISVLIYGSNLGAFIVALDDESSNELSYTLFNYLFAPYLFLFLCLICVVLHIYRLIFDRAF